MPTHNSKIRIYIRIYERLQIGDYPSKQKLIEAVQEIGEDIAERTLDRYRENMKNEFGWKVEYNRVKNGYELLTEEDAQDFGTINEIFGQSIRATFLSQATDRKAREIILFENRNDYPGIQYLNELYAACRNQHQVELKHKKFQNKNVQTYLIHPVFLKEYQNRWYVIAWVPEKKDYRSFGLERIQSVEIRDEAFPQPPQLEEERSFYDRMVGLDKAGRQVEKVRIRFWDIGVAYERTLPLHHSGREVETGENWAIFEYNLIPNFEFIQRILAQADRVEVLEPLSLKVQIQGFLNEAIKKHA